jgi:hypothetical protein
MPLVSRLGIHATDWNKQDAATRFSKIETLFGKMDPAMQQFQGSWAGMTSTIRDNARNVAKTFASPLFGSIKGEMSRALGWFGQNEDVVQLWAAALGVRVDHAFHMGLDAIHRWYGPVTTFGHTLSTSLHNAFSRVAPFLDRFEDVALKFLQDPKAVDKLMHAGSMLLAAKAGTSMLSGGASAVSGLAPLLSGAGVGAAEMAAAAPFAAGALAALAVGAEGAIHALTDGTSTFHDAAISQAASIMDHFAGSAKELAHLDNSTRNARDALGVGLLGQVDWLATELNYLLKATNAVVDAFGALDEKLQHMGRWIAGQFGAMSDPEFLGSDHKFDYGGSIKTMTAEAVREQERKIPNVTINQHNKIEVKVRTDADPNRIAAAAVDELAKLTRVARNNPLAGQLRYR